MEPSYRNYVTLMSQWYREGLIDRDIFSMNATGVAAKMTSGQAGMTIGNLNSNLNAWNLASKTTNPVFSLMLVPNPSLTKGVKSAFSSGDHPFPASTCSAISGTTKNQDLAARFLDYGYGPEGHMLFNFGVEGASYTMVNGFPTYTDFVLNNPQGWSPSEGLAAYARASYGGPMIQDERYIGQVVTTREARESLPLIINMPALKHNLPALTPTVEESQELARIMNEVNTYVDEMVTKFILGTESMNNFDNFIATIRRMNIDRAIAIQNAAWDRFNRR